MKSKAIRRRKMLARAFSTTVVVGLLMVSMQSAFGDTARSATGSAFGLELKSSLLNIPKTPEASVTAPPSNKVERKSTIPLDAGALALAGVITAVGEAHEASDIHPLLLASRPGNTNNVDIDNVNARGYAHTAAIDVVVGGAGVALPAPLPEVIRTSLVTADAIEAEAVARCVNNQPEFETGYNIADLRVAGIDLGTPVEGLLNSVLDLVDPLLDSTVLPVNIQKGRVTDINENGQKVGVMVDALVVGVPLLNLELIVSHAEARMPRDCGVAVAPPPGPQLAVTGGGGMLTFAGAGVLAAAVLAIVFVRRWRPEA